MRSLQHIDQQPAYRRTMAKARLRLHAGRAFLIGRA